MKRHAHFLKFTPVILLLLIACSQLITVFKSNLSPWKGGGFGMFSSVDRPSSRIFQSYFITESDTISIDLPNSEKFTRLKTISYTMPSNKSVDKLAEQILSHTWYCVDKEAINETEWRFCFYDKDVEQIKSEFGKNSEQVKLLKRINPKKLVISVWNTNYDNNTNKIHKNLLKRRDYNIRTQMNE